MRPVVRFETGGRRWAVAADSAVAVRRADGLRSLPGSAGEQEGLAGLLPDGEQSYPVVSVLGADAVAEHVLVLRHGVSTVGLLVQRVTGVDRADEREFAQVPPSAAGGLVAGISTESDDIVWLLDVRALVDRVGRQR